ncbi:unnamed protein product [Paramecium sonneborni]|uniref:Protein kinase domain-containing protein n=1 Tax=Paramecium sonneborni TaxID=65129 RepID=A0A8S1RI52_9CILI|nr:unnamed protein product [Paramecium sonneborni]
MQSKAKYDEFEILQCFGCPEYKVKIGKNEQGQHVLLNFFDISFRDQLQELQNIRNLEHPSILKILQIRNQGNYTKKNKRTLIRSCVIYEYPKGGELYEYLFQTGNFNETQARCYFKQIVEGLIQVHKFGLFHGELTTDTIFFSDAKQIKIGELGLNWIRKKKYVYETQGWADVNNNHQQSKDIFALGMILFSLLFGKPPFSSLSVEQNLLFQLFLIQPQKFWEKMQKNYPKVVVNDLFKDLISGMLTETPNNRMSLSEVYNHSWTQINSEFTEEMIREFQSKQKKIEQFILKASLSRQQRQMTMSDNKQQLQNGVGSFRSQDDDESKFEDLQIWKTKIKQISIEFLKSGDCLFNSNPKEIINLIKQKLQANNFNLKIIEKFTENYEFSIMFSSELEAEVKVEILQLEIEQDILCLHFIRLKGELQNYIETVKRFHQLFNKILSEISKNFQEKEQNI